ncbi:MAG TPA: hypothetical protein ENG83_12405 [Nitrospirae bacterium]|nr:ATP synthase subunit b [bacterium BMS3Abin06]HDH12978.1 hypothetical protein [Nitrospirota bacterium]HDZ02961.1 hypothetical protein [Nitrospirota bacterium]
MLEINKYFFWQLANFLILLVILNYFLFQPFLRLFKERKDKTGGALESARAMDKDKDEVLSRIDAKLSGARQEARTIFEALSKEGLDIQKHSLDSAQNEAVDINRKAKADIEEAAEKARAALKSDIEKFSKQIVEKLVGA